MFLNIILALLSLLIIVLFSTKFQKLRNYLTFTYLKVIPSILSNKEQSRKIWDNDKDYIKFNHFFTQIRNDLTVEEGHAFVNVTNRIDEVLMYCVPDGKKIRGMILIKFYKLLMGGKTISEENEAASLACGWIIEILQASCLIYDDIMDDSLTRRGKPCWFRHNNNDVLAINDGALLRTLQFKLLKKYCSKNACYLNLHDVSFQIAHQTMFGQILDCLTTQEGMRPNFSLFTRDRYSSIVKYKTSLYTFVLPIRCALYLANIKDEQMHSDVEEIMLRIGYLFQAQDDLMDVYGDPTITGKVGTDIEDGKCSWIAVEAYRKMNENEKFVFEENYGKKDEICVKIVKNLFDKLGIKSAFKTFEEKEISEIQRLLTNFCQMYNIESDISDTLLNMLYNRNK